MRLSNFLFTLIGLSLFFACSEKESMQMIPSKEITIRDTTSFFVNMTLNDQEYNFEATAGDTYSSNPNFNYLNTGSTGYYVGGRIHRKKKYIEFKDWQRNLTLSIGLAFAPSGDIDIWEYDCGEDSVYASKMFENLGSQKLCEGGTSFLECTNLSSAVATYDIKLEFIDTDNDNSVRDYYSDSDETRFLIIDNVEKHPYRNEESNNLSFEYIIDGRFKFDLYRKYRNNNDIIVTDTLSMDTAKFRLGFWLLSSCK